MQKEHWRRRQSHQSSQWRKVVTVTLLVALLAGLIPGGLPGALVRSVLPTAVAELVEATLPAPAVAQAACSGYALLAANYTSQNVQRFNSSDGSWDSTLVASVPAAANFVFQNPLPNGDLLLSTDTGAIYRYNAFTGAAVGAQPFIGAGSPNNLSFTEGMAIGQDGALYVASMQPSVSGGGAVKRFNASTGALLGTFITGGNPQGIVQASDGSWYVSSDLGGVIRKYDSNGTLLGTVKSYTSPDSVRGLAIGPDGRLYAVVPTGTGTRIERFTLPAATPATATTFLTMDSGSDPYAGIVWGPDGNLYIADYGEDEVQVYNSTGAVVRTITANLSGPHGVGFTTCSANTGGTVQLAKSTTGGDGTFTFTSSDAQFDQVSITTSGGTGNTGAAFLKTAATYTLSEDTQAGWYLTGISCTGDTDNGSVVTLASRQVVIDLDAGENIVCTFSNSTTPPATTGTIQIVKNTSGGDGSFGYTSPNATLDAIHLTTVGGTASSTVMTLSPDSYTISEDSLVGWNLTNLTCTGDSDSGNVITQVNRQVTIDLDAGENIVCTFSNTAQSSTVTGSGVLTLTKSVIGTPGGVTSYAVTVNGPSGYVTSTTVTAGVNKVLTGLPGGIYTVTETSPGAGWVTTYTVSSAPTTVLSGRAVVTLTNASSIARFTPSGSIGGTVYNDYNSDGNLTATDTGVANVRVSIYDLTGALRETTTTNASGRYTFTVASLDGVQGPYRVEFTNLPTGYEPAGSGTQNGTSVQFVNADTAAARTLNFGALDPNQKYTIAFNNTNSALNIVRAANERTARVTGNVLLMPSLLPSGITFTVQINVSGGPGAGASSVVPFPASVTRRPAQLVAGTGNGVYASASGGLGLEYEGYDSATDMVYRDPSERMTVTLQLAGGRLLKNSRMWFGDVDAQYQSSSPTAGCVGTGNPPELEDYSCRYSYIDRVQLLTNPGLNTYTRGVSAAQRIAGDVITGFYPDADGDGRGDSATNHDVSTAPSFRITVTNAAPFSQFSFLYTDPGFGIEADNDAYHDFDSGNQFIVFGISDFEVASPIEIGNRVWNDLDGDGVQDAGEPGISGVQVSLQGPTTTVNTTTDATGLYYFNNLRVTTAYTLTINPTAAQLSGYSLTAANQAVLSGTGVQSNHAISDTIDSDAALVGSGAAQRATIYYSTGSAGQNNHGLDFGFTQPVRGQVNITNTAPPSYTLSKTLLTPDPVRVGDDITFTIRITNTGSTPITTLPLRDLYDPSSLLYFSATVLPDDSTSDDQLDWSDLTASLGDLAPNASVVLTTVFVARSDTTILPGGATVNTARVLLTPSQTVTAPVRIEAPTGVDLASRSTRYDLTSGVTLAWSTASEVEIVGFHLLRREPGNGDWVRLNSELIPAQFPGQASGGSYAFTDPNVQFGRTYLYLVEMVDANGNSSRRELGLVVAGSQVLLPVIRR